MLRVFFRCVWFYSMCVGFSQPPILVSIQGADRSISKMYFCHWKPLGVSGSCRTRIPWWSNPRGNWTDAAAFMCTWEHLGAPATRRRAPTTSLGVLATRLGAPRLTVEQSGIHNIFFGNAAGVPGNHSYY